MTDTLVDQLLDAAGDTPLFGDGVQETGGGGKRGPGRPPGSKTKDAPPRSHKKLGGAAANSARARRTKKLTETLETLGGAVSMLEPVDGAIILAHGPRVAEAWARLADERPAVAKVIDGLLEGTAWSAVILTTVGMLLPIALHHGLIPVPPGLAEAMGAVGPETWAPPGAVPPPTDGGMPTWPAS